MYSSPFVAELVEKERMKDAMRHAEQARLIREAEGSRKAWGWPLPMVMAFKSVQALVIRSQAKRRVRA